MERKTKKRLGRVCLWTAALCVIFALLMLLRPSCPILHWTGFYCAGCGTSRMLEAFLRGDLKGAFRQNQFLFVGLPLAGCYLLAEAVLYVRGKPPLWKKKGMAAVLLVVLAASVLFAVARNLPGFGFLRPDS